MNRQELATRAKRGDTDAFTTLVAEQQNKLYRIAYTYTKNREDALDVVSESI